MANPEITGQNQPPAAASQAAPAPGVTVQSPAAPVAATPAAPKYMSEAEVNALFDTRYKTIQRTLSAKDRELREVRQELEQVKSRPETDVLSVVGILKKQAQADGDAARLAELQLIESAEVQRRNQSQVYAQISKAEAAGLAKENELRSKIIEAGHDPDDQKFDRVWTELKIAVKSGSPLDTVGELLDKRLGTAPAKATPAPAAKETETEMAARLEREILVKHGLLKPEAVPPSLQGAAGATVVMTRKQFATTPASEIAAMQKAGKRIQVRG